jgi:hypothetical protein
MRLPMPPMFAWLAGASVCALALAASPARAEPLRAETAGHRLVPAYDPDLQVKPPMMKATDGSSRQLLLPEGFAERAATFRRQNPGYYPAQAGMTQVGEVVVIEGSDEVLSTDGGVVEVRIPAVARKVIEKYGDNFQAMTLWLTFDETVTSQAGAYEFTVKSDVRGLGINPRDTSQVYGSAGTLRSILNMKRVWQGVNQDTEAAWRPLLEVWGQESGHRWMMFMGVRDPRTGAVSDVLLGRDCTHYSRFVDTQGSVHDGFSWTDNRDGTFTAGTERTVRFGNLDLYGMGLLPPEELPPFFFIDDIPDYRRGTCREYGDTRKPLQDRISGTRVDVTVDDIIDANGPRIPSSDHGLAGRRQDYFREVEVVVTRARETADSPLPTLVAQRIDRARLFWEQWMRTATGNRMVVCTQVSRDCGDPRSDVTRLRFNPTGRSPTWGARPGAGHKTWDHSAWGPGRRSFSTWICPGSPAARRSWSRPPATAIFIITASASIWWPAQRRCSRRASSATAAGWSTRMGTTAPRGRSGNGALPSAPRSRRAKRFSPRAPAPAAAPGPPGCRPDSRSASPSSRVGGRPWNRPRWTLRPGASRASVTGCTLPG